MHCYDRHCLLPLGHRSGGDHMFLIGGRAAW